ncbi:L,D-transpeptidase family protein [Novosphingobium sp. KCTC 2891]|uniref:L,D-transpeptidase family protein n=1 Tax=Novosphingobium sp. KCTC 2891 TaxID=2989730 RepID=UPI002222238A|nr:L,D-transpeptidase family protein [Novosphingobium sp. KCTC 2891]MCW1383371.1 L,D-transpeptidase family protein [Novosphingobium sp. KCTC 2891]
MRRLLLTTCLAVLVAGCNSNGSGQAGGEQATSAAAEPKVDPDASAVTADSMASHDPGPGEAPDSATADDKPRPMMKVQVVLERLGFAPGIVDGKMGLSTRNALLAFQEVNAVPVTGELDEQTLTVLSRWSQIGATRVVTIPADFAAGPFAPLPKDPVEQAKLPALGYASLDEKLAERFHTTVATLKELNPQIAAPQGAASPVAGAASTPVPTPTGPVFAAGQKIRVPNVGADAIDGTANADPAWLRTLVSLGVGNDQPTADRIVVSKGKGTLRAYDTAGKLIAVFTVTTGSSHDPLPLGKWKINAVDHNPKFHYNPELFWDVSDAKPKALLPPGPNGPVGVVWIDLSKEHYGIHGTPEPETIGRTQSHGCVRLTNWDAARLAQMVSKETKVEFVS